MDARVTKLEARNGVSSFPKRGQVVIERDLSKTAHSTQLREKLDLTEQVRLAGCQLRRSGLVGRRGTAGDGRDVCIDQLEAVVPMPRCWLVGKTRPMQGREQEVPRAVSSKHTPGPCAPVRRRR